MFYKYLLSEKSSLSLKEISVKIGLIREAGEVIKSGNF